MFLLLLETGVKARRALRSGSPQPPAVAPDVVGDALLSLTDD